MDDDDINSQWNPEKDRDKIDFTHFQFNPTTIQAPKLLTKKVQKIKR